MAVSETIQEILQGIDDAQYGRDMRELIHKGIQKCYEEGSAGETDLTARESIEKILEIFGDVESGDTASKAYSVGDSVVYDGRLYKVTAAIAQGDTFTEGTNIEEIQAAGDTGDAYSLPVNAITNITGVNAKCRLIVMPSAKIMQLYLDINNTTSTDYVFTCLLNTTLPLIYKDVYFGLYKWDALASTSFNGAPLGVCRIKRSKGSGTSYIQGDFSSQGKITANEHIYGLITVPYYSLSPDRPLSMGTLIDATTDWDA